MLHLPAVCGVWSYRQRRKLAAQTQINASTIKAMGKRLTWDEVKRRRNLRKHGLDFAQAGQVLESRYRLDIPVVRGGEARTMSMSYAFGLLAVLVVVHTAREDAARIISFRRASETETEIYYEWLEKEAD